MRTNSRLSHRPQPHAGFTLIELLIVVAILAILMALLSGAIRASVTNAQTQRIEMERRALTAAIINYWHDYNHWPHEEGEEDFRSKGRRIYRASNYRVFDRMSTLNDQKGFNPMGKSYLDETALSTLHKDGTLPTVDFLQSYNPGKSYEDWRREQDSKSEREARQLERNKLHTVRLSKRRTTTEPTNLPLVYNRRRQGTETLQKDGSVVDKEYGVIPFQVDINIDDNTVTVK